MREQSNTHADAWADHARTTVQRAGHRSSAQRSAVIDILARQDCVASAGEITAELSIQGSEVGIATVYRTLDLLDELGLVRRLDTREGTTRYEPEHPAGGHHHHIVCDGCGGVSQFEDAGLERAIHRVAKSVDYRVGGHDVILRGLCPACAGQSSPQS